MRDPREPSFSHFPNQKYGMKEERKKRNVVAISERKRTVVRLDFDKQEKRGSRKTSSLLRPESFKFKDNCVFFLLPHRIFFCLSWPHIPSKRSPKKFYFPERSQMKKKTRLTLLSPTACGQGRHGLISLFLFLLECSSTRWQKCGFSSFLPFPEFRNHSSSSSIF